jgi:hypothetical protein
MSEETEVSLKLTEQEINLVLRGLGELPARLSFNLIAKIQMMLQEKKDV